MWIDLKIELFKLKKKYERLVVMFFEIYRLLLFSIVC